MYLKSFLLTAFAALVAAAPLQEDSSPLSSRSSPTSTTETLSRLTWPKSFRYPPLPVVGPHPHAPFGGPPSSTLDCPWNDGKICGLYSILNYFATHTRKVHSSTESFHPSTSTPTPSPYTTSTHETPTSTSSIPGCRWNNAAKCSMYSSLHYEATHTPFVWPSPATTQTLETPKPTSSGDDDLWVVLSTNSAGHVATYVTDVQPAHTLTPGESAAFPCKFFS